MTSDDLDLLVFAYSRFFACWLYNENPCENQQRQKTKFLRKQSGQHKSLDWTFFRTNLHKPSGRTQILGWSKSPGFGLHRNKLLRRMTFVFPVFGDDNGPQLLEVLLNFQLFASGVPLHAVTAVRAGIMGKAGEWGR